MIWFTEACLTNALEMDSFISDAERCGDTEVADFFRRAQADSRKGAEQGKQLMLSRLGATG
ncbi:MULTISPECIES: hypothetical protein [unclassified Rhodococcus (in: high G+C Gram-positive bacteria)]|uniref:hypothetical protein n=1 Tax=unclassified Rhodococcus (in: high G+C Gram-positive bacteria) TaxID=192944 RepID=UPI000BE3E50B|nr:MULTISPECIES: hypothetical protein [unclassified Rhodococcus (in: high G+C Gram-positive bacteria)]